MRNRIAILTVHCKRCVKEIATASKSLYGLDNLKDNVGYICQSCASLDEKQIINQMIGEGILDAR